MTSVGTMSVNQLMFVDLKQDLLTIWYKEQLFYHKATEMPSFYIALSERAFQYTLKCIFKHINVEIQIHVT